MLSEETALQHRAVRNRGRVSQYIILDGRRHSIRPYETKVFTADIAERFVEARKPHLTLETTLNSVEIETFDGRFPGELQYVYNTTGDPDAPDFISVYDPKSKGQIEVPNPNKPPRLLSRNMGGGQKPDVLKGEKTFAQMTPIRLELYPFTRKAWPKSIVDFFLNRDAMQLAEDGKGAVARSIPKAPFEPREDWELADLNLYASIIDDDCIQCPDENEIRNLSVSKNYTKLAVVLRCSEEEVQGVNMEVLIKKAKRLMYERLFFRVANPAFNPPTEEEFKSLKPPSEPEKKLPEVGEVKRGRGRPRGSTNKTEVQSPS